MIDSDCIELRMNVIRSFGSRARSCIFRSCQLLQWSVLRSISVIGDRSMQQTVLVVSLLTVGAVDAACKRLLCLYGSQKICPSCEKWKLLKKFSGHSTCCDCRSSSSSSVPTTSIRLDRASFISFFDHEHSRGSPLSLIQRSSIVALHSLGFSIPQVAEFTHCTATTIQHWVDHFVQHGNLADEPRSGRPPVTAPDVDQSIVSMAEEICFVTPKEIRSQLQVPVSAR